MFASPPTKAAPYCSVHGQLFFAPLHAWLLVPCTSVHSWGSPPALTEVVCPACEDLALRAFKEQFPALYPAPSTGVRPLPASPSPPQNPAF